MFSKLTSGRRFASRIHKERLRRDKKKTGLEEWAKHFIQEKVRNASQHRKTCFVRRRKGEPTVRSDVYLWDWLEFRTPGGNSERLEPSHVPRGRQNGLATLETGLAISRNVPRTLSTQSNSPTHRCFPEKKWKLLCTQELDANVYGSFICNCQPLEVTQKSFSGRPAGWAVVWSHCGILH